MPVNVKYLKKAIFPHSNNSGKCGSRRSSIIEPNDTTHLLLWISFSDMESRASLRDFNTSRNSRLSPSSNSSSNFLFWDEWGVVVVIVVEEAAGTASLSAAAAAVVVVVVEAKLLLLL